MKNILQKEKMKNYLLTAASMNFTCILLMYHYGVDFNI